MVQSRERTQEVTRIRNARNRDKRQAHWKIWATEKHKADPDYFYKKRRMSHYKTNYGITVEQYEAMLVAQDGKCAICGQLQIHARHKHLSIDHDHETNEIRKLLCSNCNHGLGQFKSDPVKLRAAAAYIEAHRG